jgi:hypothetical protein
MEITNVSRKKSRRKTQNCLKQMKMNTCQNLWNATKAAVRGKLIALSVPTSKKKKKKPQRSLIHNYHCISRNLKQERIKLVEKKNKDQISKTKAKRNTLQLTP